MACREEANRHAAHYKLYISLVLFSVMEATPDTGEQFRIKLPGVDSSGVQGGRTRDAESEAKRERGSSGGRNVEAQQVALSNSRGLSR